MDAGSAFSATGPLDDGIGTAAGGMIFETGAIDAVCLGPVSRLVSLMASRTASRSRVFFATLTGRETDGEGACEASIGFTLFQLS